jgi:hypothetical protein
MMEPTGLAIGIIGLAGLFSTCLEVVEKVDSYKDFGVDSRAIISQFDADRLLLHQWGNAVGLDGSQLGEQHHANLDDPATFRAVQKILTSIQEIAELSTTVPFDQDPVRGDRAFDTHTDISSYGRLDKFRGETSRRNKMTWVLRRKARFVELSLQLGGLIERLRTLVPPEKTQAPTSLIKHHQTLHEVSDNEEIQTDDNQATLKFPLSLQHILMELEKHIERK